MELKQSGEFVFLYTTLPDEAAAQAIARALLEARLAACCNILSPMRSLYRWEGAIQDEAETAMLIKTRRSLANEAVEAARGLHPYAVPCFLTLPVESVDGPYLAWALAETLEAQ